MRPWHCLVCQCKDGTGAGSSLPSGIARAIKEAYDQILSDADERFEDAENLSFEVTRDAPPWVPLLLEQGPDSPTSGGSLDNPLVRYLEEFDLDGVAIIQQKRQERGD